MPQPKPEPPREFDEVLRRMLATPPAPHVKGKQGKPREKPGGNKKPA